MSKRLGSISTLIIFTTIVGAATETSSASKAERISEVVSRYEKYGYVNGAVLVAEHGKVIYEKGIGEANMEVHTPNTPHTKFDIASITKQFTAVLVLQQVKDEKILLQGKVSEYLPWYRKDTGGRMTIEQLLHHTSGLPEDFDTPEFSDSEAAARHYEPQEFAEKFCQKDLAAEPGIKWQYSNCGYDLLGLILERVTGKPYADLLRERLLLPLGMKESGMDRNDLAQLGGALGYLRQAGPRYSMGPYIDRAHIFSGGAMYSTVKDLLRWSQALSENGVIPKDIRDQIFRPGLQDWAYGWFVSKIPAGEPGAGNPVEEMRGDMPSNYFAWILRYPEKDGVIIVLRNGYGSTERLEQNLQAVLFDQQPRLPSRSLKDVLARAWMGLETWPGSGGVLVLVLILVAVGFCNPVHDRKHRPVLYSRLGWRPTRSNTQPQHLTTPCFAETPALHP